MNPHKGARLTPCSRALLVERIERHGLRVEEAPGRGRECADGLQVAASVSQPRPGPIAVRMAEAEPELGVLECDEGRFGGVRKGQRGRGGADKMRMFALLKRGGQVYALPVADAKGHDAAYGAENPCVV
jgi:hypothetical protein